VPAHQTGPLAQVPGRVQPEEVQGRALVRVQGALGLRADQQAESLVRVQPGLELARQTDPLAQVPGREPEPAQRVQARALEQALERQTGRQALVPELVQARVQALARQMDLRLA